LSDPSVPISRFCVAQPDPTAAAPAGWAVQISTPKSEAEAKSDVTRLNAKYASAPKGSTIGVEKAIVNGKAVYRLRVVDLSQADVAALCARLNADGRNCLVAK
jgi:sporulation related protein